MNEDGGIKRGLFWTFAERITAQIVTTVVTVVLARLLDPEHYGIISIVTVFITICNVFVTSGMGTALVQKKEVTEEDYNTAFIISIIISITLYALLFVSAPYIASFYQMNQLLAVLRVMGFRLPLAAINSIQHARIQRKMSFKRFFVATLFGTVTSGVIGIVFALIGFGVWALVAQYLTNTTIDTVVLLFVEKWFPKPYFDKEKAKEIYKFGWKVLATELTYTIEGDMRSLIIGKVFGSADLAFFEQGRKYPALIVQNVNASINKVMLPAYSRRQDACFELKELLRKSIRIGLFYMAPLLVGVAMISDTFFPLILTDKWNECIPFVKIFCLAYLTRPLESSCHQALLGVGRSGTVLRIMIAIQSVDLAIVLFAVFVLKDVMVVALASIAATATSLLLFLNYTRVVLKYSFKEQISDLGLTLIISSIMAIIVYISGLPVSNLLIKLLVQIIAGGLSYVIMSRLFKLDGYYYTIRIIRGLFRIK